MALIIIFLILGVFKFIGLEICFPGKLKRKQSITLCILNCIIILFCSHIFTKLQYWYQEPSCINMRKQNKYKGNNCKSFLIYSGYIEHMQSQNLLVVFIWISENQKVFDCPSMQRVKVGLPISTHAPPCLRSRCLHAYKPGYYITNRTNSPNKFNW